MGTPMHSTGSTSADIRQRRNLILAVNCRCSVGILSSLSHVGRGDRARLFLLARPSCKRLRVDRRSSAEQRIVGRRNASWQDQWIEIYVSGAAGFLAFNRIEG